MSTKKYNLKNGLSVLLIENHKSPVVSVQMWVKTGSADETKGQEGISHFIEHLVFKGTEKYEVGQIASSVEASGGELNAYTSFDQTVFYVTISREFIDVGLDVISEMMGFPKFDNSEIDNEREVVLEEIKRSNDSPGRQASRLLFSTVYKDHPYGIPVIGYDRIIKKVSRKTLADYYQSRYVPKNMQLVIAGDFATKEMQQKVVQSFGRLQDFKVRSVKRKKEAAQKEPRLKVQKAPFEEAQFHLAWRIPGAEHKDVAALDVLALILGQGDSSRLTRKLRLEAPLTTSIGASTFTPKDTGIFTVSGSLNAEQLQPAFAALTLELQRILAEPPSPDEIKKAITNLESEEFYSMETVDGIARKAGSLENLMGDYKYFQKFLKQIYALKPSDITAAARKYLVPQTASLILMTPKDEKEATKFLRTWMKNYGKVFTQAKVVRQAPGKKFQIKKVKWSLGEKTILDEGDVEKIQLKSGVTLLLRPNHATPVCTVKAAALGGLRIERPGQEGLTDLLSRVWTSGTKKLSEDEINQKIENMAGGLSAFGGRNSAGLSMQMLAPFEDEALELFEEVLAAPAISEAALEREKVMMLENIRSRQDNPGQVVSQMFIEEMFKGHPYGRDMYGTTETINSLSKKDVISHWKNMTSAANLTIAVTGCVDKKKWLKRLEAAGAILPEGKRIQNNFKHAGPAQDIRQYKKVEREQSHIIIGYKGLTFTDPRRYALQLIQSILAGQGGRLFLELRDKASLAYTVSPMRMEGIETGYFGAYIGCSPQKGTKAIEMLNIEFQKLVDKSVDEMELDRAKRYLIGRHDIDLQRNSAIGSAILFNDIYGVESQEVFDYAARLKPVTAKDIQKVAKEIFSQKSVLCAVGLEQPW